MKSQLNKGNATTKIHRDYSKFNIDNFKAEPDDKLKSGQVTDDKLKSGQVTDDKLKSGQVTEYSNFQNVFI